jgi:hypothetical protein
VFSDGTVLFGTSTVSSITEKAYLQLRLEFSFIRPLGRRARRPGLHPQGLQRQEQDLLRVLTPLPTALLTTAPHQVIPFSILVMLDSKFGIGHIRPFSGSIAWVQMPET